MSNGRTMVAQRLSVQVPRRQRDFVRATTIVLRRMRTLSVSTQRMWAAAVTLAIVFVAISVPTVGAEAVQSLLSASEAPAPAAAAAEVASAAEVAPVSARQPAAPTEPPSAPTTSAIEALPSASSSKLATEGRESSAPRVDQAAPAAAPTSILIPKMSTSPPPVSDGKSDPTKLSQSQPTKPPSTTAPDKNAAQPDAKEQLPDILPSVYGPPSAFPDMSPPDSSKAEIPEGILNFNVPQTLYDEDSHMFVFFIVGMLLCAAGYVGFHNKRKILALIIEGRQPHGETRRGGGGVNYKRLNTCDSQATVSVA